jgi:glycosyltransferase involved in cell wall biosynthesis
LDLLHVPSYRRMIWRQPCPLVATIHDLAPFYLREKYDWRRMLYARVCAQRLARRQKDIIAISQTTAHDISKFFGIPLQRTTVIYNGIDHERFRPINPEAASRLVAERYGLKQPYFIYVSRLEHPAKNHVRLITAFNAFKTASGLPWQLVFAGGDWHGAEAIHVAAQKSAFASDIRVLGFVPGDHLPSLYRAAGASVYPSLYEGFGLPPVEAMACACPVISSNRGSLAEVVGDAGVQLDPTDIDAWTKALHEVSSNESLRARLRDAGLKHAQQFDWKSNANSTLAVYERALGRVSFSTREEASASLHPNLQPVPVRRS